MWYKAPPVFKEEGIMRKNRKYEKEFKVQASKLVLEQGMKVGDVAKDLGVAHSSVSVWVRQYQENGGNAFPGKGKLLPWDQEKRELERKLKRVEIERDILKKTIGYLAENH
jgi:transposase